MLIRFGLGAVFLVGGDQVFRTSLRAKPCVLGALLSKPKLMNNLECDCTPQAKGVMFEIGGSDCCLSPRSRKFLPYSRPELHREGFFFIF